jgi:hypothetical protein
LDVPVVDFGCVGPCFIFFPSGKPCILKCL